MKTIKPQKIGVLHRTFEMDRRPYLVVTLFVFFPLDAPRRLLTEVEMWKTLAAEIGEGAVLDECWSKAQGEVIVDGACFPPGGAKPASYVRVKLGAVDKQLAVIGDRVWKSGVPTPPVPFKEMPVDWAHAFGGEGYALNPRGKGVATVASHGADGAELQPLPNVEIPSALVRSPADRPAPAGFAPFSLDAVQRRAKAGTYDREWLTRQAPGLAKDTDPTFFNVAAEDQRIAGYFAGDEAFLIENMHPQKPWIEGKLPGLVTRVFINQRTREGEAFRELTTRIDTVRLFPRAMRGLLVFRAMGEIAEDDAADVLQLVVACEDPKARRAVQHYRDVLGARLDKKQGPLAALRDGDLMPPPASGVEAAAPPTDVAEMIAGEQLVRKNMRRRAEAEHAKVRADFEARGLRPEDHVPPPPPDEDPPGIDDPDALAAHLDAHLALAEEQRAAGEARAAEQEKAARALCAKHGLDFEKITARRGPPTFSAAEQLERLPKSTLAANPRLPEKLRLAEEQVQEVYRRMAHLQPGVGAPDAEVSRWRGGSLMRALAGEERLAGRDYTGADLRGGDLRDRDLRGVFLEGANLEGADLSGADLTEAVLAHANLTSARLKGARVVGANLGSARLDGADLSGADLTRAILGKSHLEGARFTGATLTDADLLEALLGSVDLSGVDARELRLINASLPGAKFVGARLGKAVFLEVDLTGADFTGAALDQASFVTCKGEGAVFRKASLARATFVQSSTFPRADFREARLEATCMRGTLLDGARFEGARMEAADLSECSLRGATLRGATAPSALLVKADLSGAALSSANLMQAVLQKAKLFGADLSGANLFRADLARVHLDRATKLDGARLVQARVDPRRQDGPR